MIIIENALGRLYHRVTRSIELCEYNSYLESTILVSNFDGKVRPPLTNLPSFNVNAIILSFDGCDKDVKCLLMRLNRNSHRYSVSHATILNSFLKSSPPQSKLIKFGGDKFDCMYPRTGNQIGCGERKLSLIRYTCCKEKTYLIKA